ncbi:MAG: oligoendopeptidase F, partial [Rhabdaerophilum sp.]
MRNGDGRHRPVHANATGGGIEKKLGALPEWRLSDLYPGMDSAPYKADLAEAERESAAFAARYRGHLASLAGGPDGGKALFEAVREYEKIEDRLGRVISYAGLIYATDTTNPAHGKFYSDAQERVTTISSDLLFFTLELNRLDDAVVD